MNTVAIENTARERALFQALDTNGDGWVSGEELVQLLDHTGLKISSDPRLRATHERVQAHEREALDLRQFCEVIRPNITLIESALQGGLIIPEFAKFTAVLDAIFGAVSADTSGKVADYIPQLGRVNPEQFGVSVCTIDGQRWSAGDAETDFCVQSCCKPITYCLALEEHGEAVVHSHVGREPSGHGFNELKLNDEGKPHNPMINAGAIMCCALLKPTLPSLDRFDFLVDRWRALAGGTKAGFSNQTYLSERATADRNFALGYYMQERKIFPKGTNMLETLEFYFQACSIEQTCETLSVVASTLANGGICPLTGERLLQPQTVRNCLSMMGSCGMYDFSGEFAFTIGLPAKSGVAGAIMVVVPNVMGVCVWSPRLDRLGNSVRGIGFCRGLIDRFNFHTYDSLTGLSNKIDPRNARARSTADDVFSLIWAASKGDLTAVQRFASRGVNLDCADYDGRTPLHLAASEGHAAVVRFLLGQGVRSAPVDRWGHTPRDDAERNAHADVIQSLPG